MTVLVAEDQPVARERLVSLLAEERDVQVVGEVASGVDAVEAIRRLSPELVFLDMQMPELDGLGVIDAVGPDRMPLTIFVTAYDEYAIHAFDVHALDYLLKPFGRLRFRKALDRARHRLTLARAGALTSQLLTLVEELRPPPTTPGQRLMVRAGGRVMFVDPEQIDWIEAEGNYARLHVGADSCLMRDTMANLMERLGPDRFFRIHRSRIVRIDRIRELRLASGGDYDVVLHNGIKLGLSRLYKDALQQRLATTLAKRYL